MLAESFDGILSPGIHRSGQRGRWRPPLARQQRLGGLGVPKHISQSPPKPSKRAPSPQDALLDPNALCHREPGTEPAFFISSHLLWQPRVCLVFTSWDAWILSLLDHTRGASQRFPSSADIFLVMLFPPQPFPQSSPRSNRAAPAVDAQPQVRRGGCCWPAWPQLAPLSAWASSRSSLMPGTGCWHTGSGWAQGSRHASLLAPGGATWAARLATAFFPIWGCRGLSSV